MRAGFVAAKIVGLAVIATLSAGPVLAAPIVGAPVLNGFDPSPQGSSQVVDALATGAVSLAAGYYTQQDWADATNTFVRSDAVSPGTGQIVYFTSDLFPDYRITAPTTNQGSNSLTSANNSGTSYTASAADGLRFGLSSGSGVRSVSLVIDFGSYDTALTTFDGAVVGPSAAALSLSQLLTSESATVTFLLSDATSVVQTATGDSSVEADGLDFAFGYTAASGVTIDSITVTKTVTAGSIGLSVLDDVSFSTLPVVPEPTSLAIIGLAGMATMARRRAAAPGTGR